MPTQPLNKQTERKTMKYLPQKICMELKKHGVKSKSGMYYYNGFGDCEGKIVISYCLDKNTICPAYLAINFPEIKHFIAQAEHRAELRGRKMERDDFYAMLKWFNTADDYIKEHCNIFERVKGYEIAVSHFLGKLKQKDNDN